jgi:hypothetical protein
VTGIGYEATYLNTADDVVAIGYQAGKSNAVANQFIVKQANINTIPLIQGDFSTGNVGIGTTAPGHKLDVVGDAGKTGGGSWSDSSDIRLKTNITDLDDALSRVLELSPKEYYRLDREEKEIGLIADDVLKIFPKWVGERNPTEEELDKGLFEEDDKVKILTFPNEFNAVIVEAVKELKEEKDTEIQELKEENRKLKELICLEYPEAEICKTE